MDSHANTTDIPVWDRGGGLYIHPHMKIQGHTHNLPLELAVSYGIVATLLIFGAIIWIMIKSKKSIIQLETKIISYDNAWWTSCCLIFLNQMFDVQYFDIRIGLVFWILLSCLNNIKS